MCVIIFVLKCSNEMLSKQYFLRLACLIFAILKIKNGLALKDISICKNCLHVDRARDLFKPCAGDGTF